MSSDISLASYHHTIAEEHAENHACQQLFESSENVYMVKDDATTGISYVGSMLS
jgi:hypothetical protein